jgi:signal transduction histidine kinase
MIYSIQKRIILLLAAIGVCMLLGLLLSERMDWLRVESLLNQEKDQRAGLLQTALKFKSESIDNFVFDYTYWDEIVDYVKSPDSVWAEDNINSSIPTFDIDYAWVFDVELKPVYNIKSEDTIPDLEAIPLSAEDLRIITDTSKGPFYKFYVKSGDNIIQISGGSIHPTFDKERLTPAQGYFFAGRIWTKDYLLEIEKLSGTKLNIQFADIENNPTDSIILKKFRFINYQSLDGFDDAPRALLRSTGIVNVAMKFHYDARTRLIILAFIFILILTIVSWILIGIINRPLNVLISSLEEENTEEIGGLVDQKTEFGRIAQLINDFLIQKRRLVDEISERIKIETELTSAKERAEESDRLKTSFLNNISHEIRTPINAIVGFSDLINDPRLDEKERLNFTTIITESSYRLMGVISDLINLSSVESGQEVLTEEKFSLNVLMHEIYGQVKPLVDTYKVNLVLHVALKDTHSYITTDKTKLHQIILNLLKNSVKFTKQGKIEFGYIIRDADIEFFIKDTGIGIPRDKFEAIFARFQQADDSLSRQHGGAGLGLPISKAYAELLGGQMWVVSEVDKGTDFFFTIPFKTA